MTECQDAGKGKETCVYFPEDNEDEVCYFYMNEKDLNHCGCAKAQIEAYKNN